MATNQPKSNPQKTNFFLLLYFFLWLPPWVFVLGSFPHIFPLMLVCYICDLLTVAWGKEGVSVGICCHSLYKGKQSS